MAAQTRAIVEQILKTMNFSYRGTEEVAGRPAYELHAVLKSGQAEQSPLGMGEATLWVDSESWQVLGTEASMGEMRQMRWMTQEIEFNFVGRRRAVGGRGALWAPGTGVPLSGDGCARVLIEVER
ncbi:MAG TPA: hypothetical protein EYP04_10080 [Anaerolineae bacterium]|nr:hypothetical protein [Anaerolineae bacterium]HIQ06649.1 hypothetical protein [Anaerolineae bacterium]